MNGKSKKKSEKASTAPRELTWLQKLAWEEAWRLLDRCERNPSLLRKMGFQTIGDAATFEFKRVQNLARPVTK